MKLIVLAAGQGTRLRPLTDDRPKVLVEVNGQTILEWQLQAARAAGITEIVVVGGYCSAELQRFDIELVINEAYSTTNMVQSLFCAREHFGDDFIMAYGDIIYGSEVLSRLKNSTDAISVVVDTQWRTYWEDRFEDPMADAESLAVNTSGCISSIGQKVEELEQIEAQYIGLVRFQGLGIQHLCSAFELAKSGRLVKPSTGKMLDANQMYMTDLLQGIANQYDNLTALKITRGWVEIDSKSDLTVAETYMKQGKLEL